MFKLKNYLTLAKKACLYMNTNRCDHVFFFAFNTNYTSAIDMMTTYLLDYVIARLKLYRIDLPAGWNVGAVGAIEEVGSVLCSFSIRFFNNSPNIFR